MFNKDYSEEVPLARIFDQLMVDGERPSVILDFMELNKEAAGDILISGTCVPRLFQLDFIMRCKSDEVKRLIELVKTTKNIKYSYGPLMAWQILGCHSTKADRLKFEFRNSLNKLIEECPSARHPYRWGLGKDAYQYDSLLSTFCVNDCVADEVANWSFQVFEEYLKSCAHSMFLKRVFQYDVYEKLDPEFRFLMLSKGGKDCWDIEPLLIQILDSNESVEEKEKALEVYKNFDYEYAEDSFVGEMIRCKSFSQIMMKSTLVGSFELRDVIIELLRRNKLKILNDWINHGKEEFNSNLNVSDLVERLTEKAKTERRKNI